MPAVLRNGNRSTKEAEMKSEKTQPLKMDERASRRPTPLPPSYLLLVYPVILAVGSLFSLISPVASSSSQPAPPLAPGVASDINAPYIPIEANYFAGKRNLINIYFVKIGWFWTTLAFAFLHATTRPPRDANKQLKHYTQSTIRYLLVTISWIFTTQWFVGPPLVDRSFTFTGGRCEAPMSAISSNPAHTTLIASAPACKAVGGRWHGGHDISGHIFMLVLSSAFLIYELTLADRASAHPSVSPAAAAALAHDMTPEERSAVGGWESETIARIRLWARYFVYVVVALDFWMILMTAIWFHTWLEKLSGLLIAAATLSAVYFLGDFVPQWRNIVGGL